MEGHNKRCKFGQSDVTLLEATRLEAKPQVSWLMPLSPSEDPHNLETTLSCLETQTMQAEQLVIAADGPLPVCLSAVIKNCKLNYTLYEQQHNLGIGATLARAAHLCTGEYIVRIDSDDLYAPEHTFEMVNTLARCPELGVVGCQLIEVDMDHFRNISSRQTPVDPEAAKKWLPWRNPLNHQTVTIRKRALFEAGGYRHMPGFEDWDLWLRIVSLGYKIRSLPRATAAARVDHQHRLRRRGIAYVFNEIHFYQVQVQEGRIPQLTAVLACVSRLPWRIAPQPVLRWWMQSNLRGSPPINPAWVTKLLTVGLR